MIAVMTETPINFDRFEDLDKRQINFIIHGLCKARCEWLREGKKKKADALDPLILKFRIYKKLRWIE